MDEVLSDKQINPTYKEFTSFSEAIEYISSLTKKDTYKIKISASAKNEKKDVDLLGQVIRNASLDYIHLDLSDSIIEEISGEGVFFSKFLKSIEMPKTLKSIGWKAFESCYELENVKLNEGLKEIGPNAFKRCTSLVSIEIPKSVEIIGESAFESCDKLKNVKLNEGLKRIGEKAFLHCPSLQSIYVPNNVSIEKFAFDNSCEIERDSNYQKKTYYEAGSYYDSKKDNEPYSSQKSTNTNAIYNDYSNNTKKNENKIINSSPSKWEKTSIPKENVINLCQKYRIDPLSASIFLRRGIENGDEIKYFFEKSLRFQHNPFLFHSMENAVDRINDALPSDINLGEKILIFGDKDVDGVTATALLFDFLSEVRADVRYKVPEEDNPYGLTLEDVEEFAEEGGSLIITVDCGIANFTEIKRAKELGIDVIVLDHHKVQGEPPEEAIAVIDPKVPGCGYPFNGISGCAVAYKTVSALRFSKTDWYKAEITLLNARSENGNLVIDCIKTRNLVPIKRLSETIKTETPISQIRLPSFLSGQIIYCWDKKGITSLLYEAFGKEAEIEMVDLALEVAKFSSSLKGKPLSTLKNHSKIAKYGSHEPTEIGCLYNLFVTFALSNIKKKFPKDTEKEEKDLQLVSLAAVADVMPIRNENRLFLKSALKSMSLGQTRHGLYELIKKSELKGKPIIFSKDIGWSLTPRLNAPGRLGKASIAVALFTEKDESKRDKLAKKINELNKERKSLTDKAVSFAEKNCEILNGKLVFVADETESEENKKIARGITGLLAGRLNTKYGLPAIALTKINGVFSGSMRSDGGNLDAVDFLTKLKDNLDAFGGHSQAAGFSIKKGKEIKLENKFFNEFKKRVKELSDKIELGSGKDSDTIKVDAEIPAKYMTVENIEKILDIFEPSGHESPELTLMSLNLPVIDAKLIGSEGQHLKIIVDCGKTKWPCLFWNEGERLCRDFKIGDKVDILYTIERSFFNGKTSLSLILSDIKKSNRK